jgi:hypothetical protein
MTDNLPPALREALDAEFQGDNESFRFIVEDRARAMAAALRWEHHMPTVCLPHPECRTCDAIAALDAEATNAEA